MADMKKQLSVVLGSYNRLRFLKLTIESIRWELEQCPFSHEIVVVDGGSTDGTLMWLAKQKDIISIVQHNRGEWRGSPIETRSWGYFMNLGFKCAQGKYICMLSDDCLVVPGAIVKGVARFEEHLATGDRVGALAFYWRNWPEQQKYRVGRTLGDRMFVNHGLYLNNAMKEVGYCDEETYLFYHADGDLCLKMWEKGYTCVDAPDSYIEHYSHANLAARSSNTGKQHRDWENYLKRWQGIFYNPEKHNIGDWVEKKYDDSTLTAARFKHADGINWYRKIIAVKITSLFKERQIEEG
ncbi:glycosyltransferase family 2 protein [Geomobilimonas luticola]|uniref:Glycosyltransferase n=1 Tax=Geomobilimonas luticola TaxID=1114878 RepID=A0ABS5SCD7_9BACT|nr:glycosyltransferase [Geomobilimonas luticola]MBT0653025.1 glycosyltransferase [Geomobilimonas luticola]